MKRLEQILSANEIVNEIDNWKIQVSGLAIDSRLVQDNFMFIAYKGSVQDGHDYIPQAIAKGATVIILEDRSKISEDNVQFVVVEDTRQKLGLLASRFYDNPSSKLTVVGVTGTNGKTTTASLLFKLFGALGMKSGLLSTIENRFGGKVIPTNLTTPDAISIQSIFNDMVESEVTHVFMEVSSHALDQGRVNNIDFDVAVFSNITHDHLDYHNTFLDYIRAKKMLFDNLKSSATALVNIDDSNGMVMVQNCKAHIQSYALKRPASYKAKVIANDIQGLQLEIQGTEVFLKLVGSFNAYNALAAYGVAMICELDSLEVLTAISGLVAAEGRMEVVLGNEKNITGIVDYAHTPDALEKVLKTIKELNRKKGNVITVIGCGGNRDVTKRPIMASIAMENSDVVLLTSDNPRDEDPGEIISQMLDGIDKDKQKNVFRVEDRREAIRLACAMAKSGDIVLIAGKGHEKYQEIKGQKFSFNDKEIFSAFMH